MRGFFLLLLVLAAAPHLSSLGRLVQPDGSVVALGEQSAAGSRTLLFPAEAVPRRSWILLPRGSMAATVEVISRGERRLVAFPSIRIPDLRFALEVSEGVLALTLRGRFAENLELVRTLSPPSQGDQPWVVRSPQELRIDLPSWKTAPGWTPLLELSRPVESPWTALFLNGTKSRSFSFLPAVRNWSFAPDAWGFAPATLIVRGADPRLSELRVRAVDAQTPLPADPATLLAWPANRWRESRREWFHWSGTSVLVLVSADYRIQDAYLKRLAFYVEKAGYRGRLVTEDEVAHLHAWNAHDYAAPDLARFFSHAAQEGLVLNSAEEELRDRLIAAGILVGPREGPWKAGAGALVGISVESAPGLRSALFVHEAFHGLYFTTPTFRDGVRTAWEGLSEPAREAFRTYLTQFRYDPADESLMRNEFQAYVLQRPEEEWAGFFRGRVLAGYPASGQQAVWVAEYLNAARHLDSLVKALFGFPSGDVSPVKPF